MSGSHPISVLWLTNSKHQSPSVSQWHITDWLAGQFADKLTHGQSSRRMVNSWTSQLADNKLLKITEILHYISTLTLTITRLNIGSVHTVFSTKDLSDDVLQIFHQTFQRVDQSATWLTASQFISELSGYNWMRHDHILQMTITYHFIIRFVSLNKMLIKPIASNVPTSPLNNNNNKMTSAVTWLESLQGRRTMFAARTLETVTL